MQRTMIKFICNFIAASSAIIALYAFSPTVLAHGERSQEPFLRMRTIHWYDTSWSTDKVGINDKVVLTGRFHIYEEWPEVINKPEVAYLANATPGPVFAREESYINEVPMLKSTKLELGRDYEYRVVLRGRIAGRHHVHPMINVQSAGGLVGPGLWITVSENGQAPTAPITTLTGETVDMEHYGIEDVYKWHIIWAVIAVAWLLWWLRRPLIIPRYRMVLAGDEEDALITSTDKIVALVLFFGVIALVIVGTQMARSKYPISIPLQTGIVHVDPLPRAPEVVTIKLKDSRYRIPGRSMTMELEVTNHGDKAVTLGEFNSASIRFLNPDVVKILPGYPGDMVAEEGLTIEGDQWIQPGETRIVNVKAQDALWETERLSSLILDPDSRFGGLLFFFDAEGNRFITEVGGPILPTFI